MRKNIRRMFAAILSAILIVNCLQLPGCDVRAAELETVLETNYEDGAETVPESDAVIDSDINKDIEEEQSNEEQSNEEQLNEEQSNEEQSNEEQSNEEQSGEKQEENMAITTVPDKVVTTTTEEESETEEVSLETEDISVTEQENLTIVEDKSEQSEGEGENNIVLSDALWVEGFERESESLVYTGNKITQNFCIYYKGTLLEETKDYVLSYKNNINAAAYNSLTAPSVTITMKGQYTGSWTLYFTIAPRDIAECDVPEYEQVISYSEKVEIPVPTIYSGNKKLVSDQDFVCDYSSLPKDYTMGDCYVEGATYEYTVKGVGNFTGSLTVTLTVVKDKNLDFGNAAISLDKKQYEYHGEALVASDIQIISVELGDHVLDSSLYEYTVYAEGAGTGYVEVYPTEAGRSAGYRGMKKLEIKVVGDRNIKDTELGANWQDSITFLGMEVKTNGGICQEKTGVLSFHEGNGRETLTEGVDYTVTYSNHTKVGKATVVFTGIGRYKGSFKMTYMIVPNTQLYVKWHDINEQGAPFASYVKGGAIPEFDLLESAESEDSCILDSSKDYTVKLKNNKETGMMTCEIIGKGNYEGYRSITELEVISADIGQGTMIVQDKQYSESTNAWKSGVTIKDINGKKLKAGTDYEKQLSYSYAGMEDGMPPKAGTVVQVTAFGINNYEGSSITGSYRIYSMNLSELTIVIDAQEYTGEDITLSADDIHVYANKEDAKEGIEIAEPCYEIVGYSDNRKVGIAKVTLRGIGEYGTTHTYSFKIMKKEYLTTQVAGISLNETSMELEVGKSRQLTATISPEDAWNKTVIWTTSNREIATVSEEGIVTANWPGTVIIQAISQETGEIASCTVNVEIAFSLNAEEICQDEGTTYQLVATIQPADSVYSSVRWESTNPEIASVDANGKVSLNKAGMAVIKAYADEDRLVRKCLVFVSSKEEEVPEGAYLTPQMFRTCDEDDDTKAFNDAIKSISSDCNTVYIPAGTYKIDAETGILLKSNMNFVMSPNAILQAINNSSKSYNVIRVRDCCNVTISGGHIRGERYGHGGTSGEWGMGIGLYDCTNITLTGIGISNCWGDGIYIGSSREENYKYGDYSVGCKQITVTNCNVNNNRRNNLSIVCADYVTIDQCEFNYANGTAPQYGIDIETNVYSNPCEHITISNSSFTGNAQASIGIITAANDINIVGCTLNGSFINYDGQNVTISNSIINGKMYARIGVSLVDGTTINDGSEEEDLLVAAYNADSSSCILGQYGIDASNLMSNSVIEDSDSPSGTALCIKRESTGTQEAGYYFNLSILTEGVLSMLEAGATYRFEYVIKGSGQWGIKTNQTGWYPCVATSDKFSTGVTTYAAGSANRCNLMVYAVDKMKDMYLEIASIKIYKVR